MGYLDDRQRIVTTVKAIDGLADKIHAIYSELSLDQIATGIEIDLTAGQLNPTFWEPYTIRLDVAFPDCSIGNWIGILATTDAALDVEQLGSNAQGAFNLRGTINDIQNTTTPIYCCVLPTSALPSDVQIDFVSLRVQDADANTVPDSNYSCDFVGFAPVATPLSTPANVAVSNITDSSCVISWNAVPNAISYEVVLAWRASNSHEPSTRSFSSATNQLSISELDSSQEYASVVRAIGDGTYYTNSDYAGGYSSNDAYNDAYGVWYHSTLRFTTLKASSLSDVTVTFETATSVRVVNNSSDSMVFILYKPASAALSKSTMTLTQVRGSGNVSANGTINLVRIVPTSEYVLTYPAEINTIGVLPYNSNNSGLVMGDVQSWTQNVKSGLYAAADTLFNTSDNVYVYERQISLSSPTGLIADRVTSTSARVGWNVVENASDYKVEYREQGQTNWLEQ